MDYAFLTESPDEEEEGEILEGFNFDWGKGLTKKADGKGKRGRYLTIGPNSCCLIDRLQKLNFRPLLFRNCTPWKKHTQFGSRSWDHLSFASLSVRFTLDYCRYGLNLVYINREKIYWPSRLVPVLAAAFAAFNSGWKIIGLIQRIWLCHSPYMSIAQVDYNSLKRLLNKINWPSLSVRFWGRVKLLLIYQTIHISIYCLGQSTTMHDNLGK